jgi:hypothetical protein
MRDKKNDTAVCEVFAYDAQSGEPTIWVGTGDPIVALRCGFWPDRASVMYHPYQDLTNGWAVVAPGFRELLLGEPR